MRFNKREKKDYDFKIIQLKKELPTERHISACLGSIGLTFVSDIKRFSDYLKFKKEFDLLKIINNDRNLTKKEIKNLKKKWKFPKIKKNIEFKCLECDSYFLVEGDNFNCPNCENENLTNKCLDKNIKEELKK